VWAVLGDDDLLLTEHSFKISPFGGDEVDIYIGDVTLDTDGQTIWLRVPIDIKGQG
jgi:hypothetical protein